LYHSNYRRKSILTSSVKKNPSIIIWGQPQKTQLWLFPQMTSTPSSAGSLERATEREKRRRMTPAEMLIFAIVDAERSSDAFHRAAPSSHATLSCSGSLLESSTEGEKRPRLNRAHDFVNMLVGTSRRKTASQSAAPPTKQAAVLQSCSPTLQTASPCSPTLQTASPCSPTLQTASPCSPTLLQKCSSLQVLPLGRVLHSSPAGTALSERFMSALNDSVGMRRQYTTGSVVARVLRVEDENTEHCEDGQRADECLEARGLGDDRAWADVNRFVSDDYLHALDE
jgi:hypothetical protein